MPGGFYHPGPEFMARAEEFGEPWITLEIGAVDQQDMQELHDAMKQVEIVKDEASSWNCQDCTLAAFRLLKAKGHDRIVYGDVYDRDTTVEAVESWLKL